ncbi:alpha-amylase/4-alpha-glucanotransferase domain-containing protein [Nitratifractor salsuginis]|uniref:4-alpha-glucanotransferase n=1 Tax=Nitratifractor salsuginis (strain DSM 16511 / JCM 12458 / E9I37-1) TaxID=749222 RepID=E6X3H1_NITSE|nr:alpha-amylase/4-alpha-glucanotransferase domain-containing protein [Nitratifractor salsuginis]ADV46248.1 4-alpha-glucanotransferase [Nitratifractor salsuginis DSM 16511]
MTRLLFGLHMHQPVENLDEAVSRAIERCYAPLFETLARYPEFKFSLHCSGWLLEKLKRDAPEVYGNLKRLSDAGAIEWFSAGYYEPILASIPSSDRLEQIGRLSKTLEAEFGQTPRGLWLTERVWENGLVADLRAAGVEYAVVDDYHLIAAGFDPEEIEGYFLTEEGGEKLALFPISKALRYAIPFHEAPQSIEAVAQRKLAVIFDDAEKFGLWPETHEWVYTKGWLKAFIEGVLADERIETAHYADALNERPTGLAYLPNVSYYEMGEWSLRAKDTLELEKLQKRFDEEYFEKVGIKFIRGGIWKNFFVKYEESNRLHKRMLQMNRLLLPEENREDLYRLQCNDVYWHGVFGGLYLPNLRDNAYRYLARCEKLLKRETSVEDSDFDGYEESRVNDGTFVYRFYERSGGQLIELLDLEREFNFQNTLTRRYEAYHEAILNPPASSARESTQEEPENGIRTIHSLPHRADEATLRELHFDWYTKNSLIDHISDEHFDRESFRCCTFREFGDFANQPFEMLAPLHFRREGGLYTERKHPTSLEKRYSLEKGTLHFSIDLQTEAEGIYRYALEFNLHFAHYDTLRIQGKSLNEGLEILGSEFMIEDPYTGRTLTLSFDREMEGYFVPLRTVSQDEAGYSLTTQALSIAMVAPFESTMELKGSLCLS